MPQLPIRDAADLIQADQADHWRRGEGIPAEEYLALHPDFQECEEPTVDVIFGEYLLREEQEGEADLEEYLERFPLHAERLKQLVSLEEALQAEQLTWADMDADSEVPAKRAVEMSVPRVAGYEILRPIGRGGMAVVYLARERKLDRLVALKLLVPTDSVDPRAAARFRTEARAIARIRHPNIVQIHSVGEENDRPFLAMEYVEGGNLRRTDGTPQPAREAARIVLAVARGVAEAHRLGVVHRDLKPANILIGSDGTPKIADFGLAKFLDEGCRLTNSNVLVGSPCYMAPEQAKPDADPTGPACDIHALGVILYELLTGRPPFGGASVAVALEQVRFSEPVPPSRLIPRIPRDLETICLRCLAKEPGRRYESADALAEDLNRFLEDRPILARRAGLVEQGWRMACRRPVVVGLSASLLVSLVSGFVGMTVLMALATHSAEVAREQKALASKDERRAVGLMEAEARSRRAAELNAAQRTLDKGMGLAEHGLVGPGVLWMAEALRQAPDDARDLRSAIARNIATWSEHAARPRAIRSDSRTQAVDDLVVAPDGRTALFVNNKGFAQLVDLETLSPIITFQEETTYANSAMFSPDGSRVLVVGYDEGIARIYDARRGTLLRSLRPEGGIAQQAYFASRGRHVITLDRGAGRLDLWDTKTGRHLGESSSWPPGSRLEGDGRAGPLVAVSTNDGRTNVLEVETLKPIGPPIQLERRLTSTRFGPEGLRFVTWDHDRSWPGSRLLVFEAERPDVPAFTREFRSGIRDVCFRRDGTALAMAEDDGTIHVLDAASGEPVSPILRAGSPLIAWEHRPIEFSPDGQFLLTEHLDSSVRIWDLSVGRTTGSVLQHQAGIRSARFVGDGLAVVTSGDDGRLIVWDIAPSLSLGRVVPMPSTVKTADLGPDRSTLAVADYRDAAWLVDLESGSPVSYPMMHNWAMASGGPFEYEGVIRSVRVADDGSGRVVTAGDDRMVRVWTREGRPEIGPLPQPHWALMAALAPDGRSMVCTTATNLAFLWDLHGDRPKRHTLEHLKTSGAVRLAYAGPRVVISLGMSEDDHLSFWDSRDGRELGRLDGFGHWPEAVWTSSDGSTAFVYHRERKSVHVIDVEKRARRIEIGRSILTACSSPDGAKLLAACQDRAARLWDTRTGQLLGPAMEHPATITAVALSRDGRLALTGAEDGRLRLWDTASGLPIGPALRHGPGPGQVFFGPGDRSVIGVGTIVTVHDLPDLAEVTPESALALARSVTALRLDKDGRVRSLDERDWRPVEGETLSESRARTHRRLAARFETNRRHDAARWHRDRLVPRDRWPRGEREGRTGRAHASQYRQAVRALREARSAERRGDDEAVVAALDELIGAGVDSDGPRWWRALASLRVGDLQGAAEDLKRSKDLYPGWRGKGEAALMLLGSNRAKYRAFCSSRAESLERPNSGAANAAAWLFCLGPDALDDPEVAVRLARAAVDGSEDRRSRRESLRTLGAAEYRAGRPEEGRTALMRGLALSGGVGDGRDAAFLAMCHARLGDIKHARQWLDRVPVDLASIRRLESPLDLEIVVLFREAEVTLFDAAFPAQPFSGS